MGLAINFIITFFLIFLMATTGKNEGRAQSPNRLPGMTRSLSQDEIQLADMLAQAQATGGASRDEQRACVAPWATPTWIDLVLAGACAPCMAHAHHSEPRWRARGCADKCAGHAGRVPGA